MEDGYEELQLGDGDGAKEKVRRFSVHDVVEEDNNISYGEPDNQAMADSGDNISRIASVDIDDGTDDGSVNNNKSNQINRSSIHSDSHKSEDDDNANVFIHENVDDNDEYMTNEHIINDNQYEAQQQQQTEDINNNNEANAARGSKENTPTKSSYPSHYRHPSLAAHENPVSDDEEYDKDHKRTGTSLVHEGVDSDSEEIEMTPFHDQVLHHQKFTLLKDFWCHDSKGIMIEKDTDIDTLHEKQTKSVEHLNHNVKGSVHEINNYERPMMMKMEECGRWDTVFGSGTIDDVDGKVEKNENGQFIEWILEIQEMQKQQDLKTEDAATIILGISSDLGPEKDEDDGQNYKQQAFTNTKHGFGFSNFGDILHENKKFQPISDLAFKFDEKNVISSTDRRIVHIILDYSDPNEWILYANVGGVDEEDYDDLSHAHTIIKVHDKIPPGSYRLAVSLKNAYGVWLESCKIYGTEQGGFAQNLKQYLTIDHDHDKTQQNEAEIANDNDDEEDIKQTETENQPQTTSQQSTDNNIVEEKVIEPQQQQQPPPPISNDNANNKTQTINEPKDTVKIEVSPSPQILLTPPPPTGNTQSEDEKEVEVPVKPLSSMKSVIVHDDAVEDDEFNDDNDVEHEDQIQQQTQTMIEQYKREIVELQQENENKLSLLNQAKEKEKQQNDKIKTMERELNDYKGNIQEIQERSDEFERKYLEQQQELSKIDNITQENQRLTHELKLAQDRVKGLEDKKQEIQLKLNNAIESKMKLIMSTSEEIDHYRKLIQQIAQNKLGCQMLSDFMKNDTNSNQYRNGGQNGYY